MSDPTLPPLMAALPEPGADADAILDAFLGWVETQQLTLYDAQEEAILELFAGQHVILNTPTGSGKSLVATAMCFRAMALDERVFYTCPIKALVSEKFFDLCELFGAEQVGMLTGDASINHDAPIVCCTAEILANMALRHGDNADVDQVVMDEFHYYGDAERGIAWQLPLLTLPNVSFLLMSATLGDTDHIARGIEARTNREVCLVASVQRPVPLDFEYKEIPLHENVIDLVEGGRAPVYVVSFTQRECAELAQGLSSFNLSTREGREAIRNELGKTRFDSPYGADIKRVLSNGIGLHHAGLLPKYRRVVEKLAQGGLLKVICGTDTLGVGVNVPIRTVLFTKLCKFDGQKVNRLTAREFKQIAGRAGRKGFDDRGTVSCQAPPHVIENRILENKAGDDPKKRRKLKYKQAPDRGYVHWDKEVFEQLIERDPEPLKSRFVVNHGMLVTLLQSHDERGGGYRALVELIAQCDERPHDKRRLRREAKLVFRSLMQAELIVVTRVASGRGGQVRVSDDLQAEFSLHNSLALFLVEALSELDVDDEEFHLRALGLVEAILEHPRVVLYAQERKLKDELMASMKAEGIEYEERIEKLERVTYPKPDADAIYDSFNAYRARHPWLTDDNIRPKSIARDMFERFASFSEYVKEYGLKTAEGVLLRYLSQAYKVLVQSVPEGYRTDGVLEVIAFLRATLQRVDSSLVSEWEQMAEGEARGATEEPAAAYDITRDPKALKTRLRAEMHLLLRALSAGDYEEAAHCVRGAPDVEPEGGVWDADRIEAALAPFVEAHGPPPFGVQARLAERTQQEEISPRVYRVRQILCDPEDALDWYIEATVDFSNNREGAADDAGGLLQLQHIGD